VGGRRHAEDGRLALLTHSRLLHPRQPALQPTQLTRMSILKRCGRQRSSLVRMHSPMSVAMLQCSTVGVNCTLSHVVTRWGVRAVSVCVHPGVSPRPALHQQQHTRHATHSTCPPVSSTLMSSSSTTLSCSRE
jgi:hypothetical protein